MAIRFIVTDAGRAALTNDDNTGTGARQIAEIGLGRGQYTAGDRTRTDLVDPIKRVDTIAGETVAPDTIHVTLQDESNDIYSVGEIGLFLDNGVLFGYFSQPDDWIIEKASPATLLLANDIEFADIDVSSLTFGDAAFLNPPASTTVKGVLELATQEEVDAGKDDRRGVVPRTLKAFIDKVLTAYATVKQLTDHAASRDHPGATTSAQGMIELATYGETQAGEDNTRAVTPAALNTRTATSSRTGLVERATDTEAKAGADAAVVPSVAQVFLAFQQFGLGVSVEPGWPLASMDDDPTQVPSGIYRSVSGTQGRPGGSGTVILTRYNSTQASIFYLEDNTSNQRMFRRQYAPDTGWTEWVEIYHSGRMGAGSGMDADKLDGQHGDYYRNADNLNTGTVPLGRLSSATENERGVLQIATTSEAKEGSTNGRTMTPARVADYVTQFGVGDAAPDGNALFGSDFNTFIRRDVIVTCSGNWQHGPDGNASIAGILINLSRTYSNQITQTVIDGARKFWRSGNPSTEAWDSWRLDWNDQNHGAGSGMDADKLDGQHGDFYRDAGNLKSGTVPLGRLPSATETDRGILQIATAAEAIAGSTNGRTMTPLRVANQLDSLGLGSVTCPTWPLGSLNSDPGNVRSGLYRATSTTAGRPGSSGTLLFTRYSSTQCSIFYLEDGTSDQRTFRRRWVDGAGWEDWAEFWHSGRQGAGTGMDADKLDGQHGDFYRDAGNLNRGTVPLARLTSATETDRGILQIASFDEAVAGSSSARTMTPLRSVNLLNSFGIGTDSVPTWPYSSMNSSPAQVPSGIYRATSNTDGKPAGSGTFLLTRYASTQASVFYMEDATSGQRIFRRRWLDGDGWSSWVEIMHSGMSDQSLTAHGYCKMPNGLILQWGTHDVDSYETFPISFPNNCASVVLTDLGELNTGDLSVYSVSNSGFRIRAGVPTSGGAYYMAVGY